MPLFVRRALEPSTWQATALDPDLLDIGTTLLTLYMATHYD